MIRLKNESGQALLLVLMVIMVLVMIGAAALTRTSGSRLRSFEEKKMVQASYIAEAGTEKALASVKNDPTWLKGLAYNTVNNYITDLAYAGGQITSVKVIRTSSNEANPTIFSIESTGDYQGTTRTIKVTGEVRDGITFAKGIWVNSATNFENKVECYCDIICKSTLTFKNNDIVYGNIVAEGTVDVKNGMTAYSIISGQDVIIKNNLVISDQNELIESNLEVTSQIIAGGNVNIDKGFVGGKVSAIGNITLENKVNITGDVYFNGELYMDNDKSSTGTPHKGGAVPFEVNIPSLPVIDEDMYSNPDRTIDSGILSGDYDIDGINYAPGNLDISGTYSGKGVIVAHGKVTISGDLFRANEDSSLVIIALGQVDGVGISSNNETTYAQLFSPYLIDLNTDKFYGSMICDSVELGNKTVVRYDDDLYQNQPEGLASFVKVKSWKENYSVF
ncbi:MAG: hypothetical protein PHT62_13820 [Desulfotomaculaceae bacterium]|nr:hypothetical protein [Desulfotomaculaceae bacterium]